MPSRRGDDHVVLAGRDVDPGELVLLVEDDRPDAGRADAFELLERRLLDLAATGREHEVRPGGELGQGDRRHRHLAGLDLDAGHVDDRQPLRLARRVRDGVHLRREDPAAVGEEQRPVVGVGHEQVLDGVLLARDVADDALAAAVLAAVRADRLALDVAAAADRDDDVLVGDEVLVGELARGVLGDAGPAIAGVLALRCSRQLVLDDRQDPLLVGEDVLELGDQLDDLEVLVLDLLALERGEAGKPHVQDRLGLALGQVELRHEVRPRDLGVGRGADRLDDRVEVVERLLEALEDVGPVARLAEVELGPPPDDLAAVLDVVLEDRLEGQRLGLPVDQGQHVHVERALERGVLEQVVQHAVRVRLALDLDDHAHAVAVGLVAQVGDAVDLLVLDEVGDLLDAAPTCSPGTAAR